MKFCTDLNDFIVHNDRDVRRIIISQFKNLVISRHDLTLDDFIQGLYLNMAKQNAVEKFNPEFGVKFSTYIFRCIKNYMIAFQVKISNKSRNFLSAISLDDPQERNCSLHETIGTDEIKSNLDIDAMYREILKKESKHTYPSKLKLSKLYQLYVDGYKDAEISKMFSITPAAVGARKRSLQKIVATLL